MEYQGPIAIKYSRGNAFYGLKEQLEPIVYGKSEILFEGEQVALLSVGNMVEEAYEVYERLSEQGISITLVNARFVKPIDEDMIDQLAKRHHTIITLEEHVLQGGYGQAVSAYCMRHRMTDVQVNNIAIEDMFVEHGKVDELRKRLQIDADHVMKIVMDSMSAFQNRNR